MAAVTVLPQRPAYVIWLAGMVVAMLGSVALLASSL